MIDYKTVQEIDEQSAKANFKDKAQELANAMREFSKAWERLEMYTEVDTLEEPFTDIGDIFNGSLDAITSDFNEWADNLENEKELK